MAVEIQWITEKKKGKLLLLILDQWGGLSVYTRAMGVPWELGGFSGKKE